MEGFKSLSVSKKERDVLYASLSEDGRQLVDWRTKQIKAKITSGACYTVAKWLDNLHIAGVLLTGGLGTLESDWVARQVVWLTSGSVSATGRGVAISTTLGGALIIVYKMWDQKRHLAKAERYTHLENLAWEGYNQKRLQVATGEAPSCTPDLFVCEKQSVDMELPLAISDTAHAWSKYRTLRENLTCQVGKPYDRNGLSFLWHYWTGGWKMLQKEIDEMDQHGRCLVLRQVANETEKKN